VNAPAPEATGQLVTHGHSFQLRRGSLMFLETIGYRPEIEASFVAVAADGLSPGRVVRAEGMRAQVLAEDGRERSLLVPRRLVTETSWPVAGDWVAYDEARAVVSHVLPRTSVFERRRVGKSEAVQAVAANIDLAVVVMGLDADFSPRRLSRYLALAHGHGIAAAVLLTKACDGEHAQSCSVLADLTEGGVGVAKDAALASKLRQRACTLGFQDACQ